jgi:hypothetical protein
MRVFELSFNSIDEQKRLRLVMRHHVNGDCNRQDEDVILPGGDFDPVGISVRRNHFLEISATFLHPCLTEYSKSKTLPCTSRSGPSLTLTAQRFSPRRPKSKYSQANIERLRYLVAKKIVIKEVAVTLDDILNAEFVFPPDILKAIKANKEAWRNYQKFSDPYKRIRVAFIDGARSRPEEFKKRLRHFIEMTEKNNMFGFGGIEKHY